MNKNNKITLNNEFEDKFRFRFAYRNIIHEVSEINFDNGLLKVYCEELGTLIFLAVSQGKLLLSTGIRDRENELIFEGDILENLRDGTLLRAVYNAFAKDFTLISMKTGTHTFYDKRLISSLKKVGNIYTEEKMEVLK